MCVGFTLACAFFLLRYASIPPFAQARTQIAATAITTASNQHLANIVAPPAEIEAIIANVQREFVPTEYATHSDTEAIATGEETSHCTAGFTMLEQGVYFREVSGAALRGQVMLITDPSRIIVATACRPGRQPSNVKSMVNAHAGAIGGINGGWYSGFSPVGFVIANGQRVYPLETVEGSYTIAGFTQDNVLVVGNFSEEEALAAGIRDSLHTYPVLVLDGEPQITTGDGGWGIAPRTAIGQRLDGAVLLLTIDGRQWNSVGATQRQVQDIFVELGAHNAIGLDGGSSSAMYFRGDYLNRPSLGYERSVPTAFLVVE